jgi:opacity protein-like surface antigen
MINKKLLVGVIAFGLSTVALANGNVYSEPVAPAAVAASSDFTPGIYFGLQAGYVNADMNSDDSNRKVKNDSGIVGGRLFVGYDFHRYFAAEMGYMMYSPAIKVSEKNTNPEAKLYETKISAFDLVGKLKAPVTDGVNVYAKAGAGYLMLKNDKIAPSERANLSSSNDRIDLVYGLGVSYDITPNWIADVSWTRYNGDYTAKVKKAQPNVDFYALGIAYKINM